LTLKDLPASHGLSPPAGNLQLHPRFPPDYPYLVKIGFLLETRRQRLPGSLLQGKTGCQTNQFILIHSRLFFSRENARKKTWPAGGLPDSFQFHNIHAYPDWSHGKTSFLNIVSVPAFFHNTKTGAA